MNSLEQHFKEWGGRYIASIFLGYLVHLFLLNEQSGTLIFSILVTFFLIEITYEAGYAKAKEKFFIPEPPDEKVISDYGKIIELLSQITYSPTSFPESFLPFNKEKIREAMENEIHIIELVSKVDEKEAEKNKKYLDSLKSCLFALDGYFLPDEEAIEKNKKFKDLLLGSSKKTN